MRGLERNPPKFEPTRRPPLHFGVFHVCMLLSQSVHGLCYVVCRFMTCRDGKQKSWAAMTQNDSSGAVCNIMVW